MFEYVKSRALPVLFVLGAWVFVSMLFAVQSAVRMNVPVSGISLYSFASWLPVVLFTPLIGAVAKRYRFIEGERGKSALAHLATMLAFMVIGASMMGALEWLIPGDVGAPMTLRRAMFRAIPAYMAVDFLTYVLIAAAFQAIAYARESRERSLIAASLSLQLAQARMHALTARLHPHFLFNTLNGISALVREDPKRAESLIARLSELLRDTLDENGPDRITLGEELNLLKKYLEIQEARFGDRLMVNIDASPAALRSEVPKLMLQPVVENAIRHGLAPKAAGGMIAILADIESGVLLIEVSDDGVGLPDHLDFKEGLGLSISHARLQQFGGDRTSLTLEPREGGGTVCTIRIPTDASEEGSQ